MSLQPTHFEKHTYYAPSFVASGVCLLRDLMSEGLQDDGYRWQEGRRWWRRREGDRQARCSRGADSCTSLKMGHRRMVPGRLQCKRLYE